VLVHSSWAEQTIRQTDDEVAVRVVPMGVPLPELTDPAATRRWRQQVGVPEEAPLVGSFGFQTPIKRTDRTIAALARPTLSDVHLVVGGEISARNDLKQAAAEAGVADRVHFLGFLDYTEFEIAIGACDLCLNLRYPTAGETSASLLRELAAGRPVVVSDYAQFADLPDAVGIKVPLGDQEVEAIATEVGDLLHNQERLREMSDAARLFIEQNHSPERAAAAVVEACTELAGLHPPGDRPVHSPRPTSLVWRQLTGALEVEGLDMPWPAGAARLIRIRLRNTGFARWLSADRGPGGVMIELHWRAQLADQGAGRQWLELPRDLRPDESIELKVRLRRPNENANFLIIEPHVKEVGGFNTIGGPHWSLGLE
jgi:hypothetical protein